MREHEAIDNRLTPLGPLAVMRPDALRAVPQDVRHFISVLLLGHIGSHLDITSGWRGHQAKHGRGRHYFCGRRITKSTSSPMEEKPLIGSNRRGLAGTASTVGASTRPDGLFQILHPDTARFLIG